MRGLGAALALCLASCANKGGAKGDAGALRVDAGLAAEAAAPDAGEGGAEASQAAPLPGPAIDALPAPIGDEWTARAHHLLEAIAKDDPTLATDILFPRDAFVAVKDVADPGKQWDDRVASVFQKQVHLLHKRTKGIERAEFAGFELGAPIAQVVPKKHDLKVALWSVRRSRLSFTIDGKASRVDLAEIMSWRGSWYVLALR